MSALRPASSEQIKRRVGLSLNAPQLRWLHSVLTTVHRGGDARVMCRNEAAAETTSLLFRALQRAEAAAPNKTLKDRYRCRNGHVYSEHEPLFHNYGGAPSRRCRVCLQARRLEHRERVRAFRVKREEAEQEAAVSA